MKLFPRSSNTECLVISIDQRHCHLYHFQHSQSNLVPVNQGEFAYDGRDQLKTLIIDWVKNNHCRSLPCRFVLCRELYQTYNLKAPAVAAAEMDQALKWQVKDLIDQPLEEILVSHYIPTQPDTQEAKVEAVVTERELVELLIDTAKNASLELESIDVEELTIGHALAAQIDPDRVTGFIGEDATGLVFNFYWHEGLAFTRHKKGLSLPGNDELSLEEDRQAREEAFLLETQRTLDYVISQIFRRPVDKLLLQGADAGNQALATLINQVTEVPVDAVATQLELAADAPSEPPLTVVGSALQVGA